MIRAGVDFAFAPRANHVARTILLCAEKRTATVDAFLLAGLVGIVRRVRALRIARDNARDSKPGVGVGAVPVARPLPCVAGHVVKAVTVGWKLRHRRDAQATSFFLMCPILRLIVVYALNEWKADKRTLILVEPRTIGNWLF